MSPKTPPPGTERFAGAASHQASGIIAVGDSITVACSSDLCVGGVPACSWAQWTSAALGESLTVYAEPGASTARILELLPGTIPTARIGLVYAGVNNIVSWKNWRSQDLEQDLTEIVRRVAASVGQVLVMQYPVALGRARAVLPYGPFLRPRVSAAQQVLRRVCAEQRALLIETIPFEAGAVWIDGLHPTSTGHLAMADAVLAQLGEAPIRRTMSWEPPALRQDFGRWKRNFHLRFAMQQPFHGVGSWLFGH